MKIIETIAMDILDFFRGVGPTNKKMLAKYWKMDRWDVDAKMQRLAEQKALEFYSQTL